MTVDSNKCACKTCKKIRTLLGSCMLFTTPEAQAVWDLKRIWMEELLS